MKAFAAQMANAVLTKVAKRLVLTGCVFLCHQADAPDELFSK